MQSSCQASAKPLPPSLCIRMVKAQPMTLPSPFSFWDDCTLVAGHRWSLHCHTLFRTDPRPLSRQTLTTVPRLAVGSLSIEPVPHAWCLCPFSWNDNRESCQCRTLVLLLYTPLVVADPVSVGWEAHQLLRVCNGQALVRRQGSPLTGYAGRWGRDGLTPACPQGSVETISCPFD